MLPVCSATPTGSSHPQVSLHFGQRAFSLLRKSIDERCILEDKVFLSLQKGIHGREASCRTNATKFLYGNFVERSNQSGSMDLGSISPHPNELDYFVHRFPDECIYVEPKELGYSMNKINGPYLRGDDLHYVESSATSWKEEQLFNDQFGNDTLNDLNGATIMSGPSTSSYTEFQSAASPSGHEPSVLPDQLSQSINIFSESETFELSTTTTKNSTITLSEKPNSVSDTLEVANDALPKLKENIDSFLSGINQSMDTSIDNANSTINNLYDAISSSLTDTIKNVRETFENSVNGVLSSVDNTGEQAGNKLSGFGSGFKESTYKVGAVAVDVLRRVLVAVDDSLANAPTSVVYYYGSAKAYLPPEIRDVLNSTEERAIEVLRPINTALQQVYIRIEELEKYIGLDPNDPIVPFILFLGSITTLGVSYWVFKYGGYSGDLSPKSTLELLSSEGSSVLIDVRPEDLRERDGVPDLRRGARFRYASVSLPEVDASVKKLLKNGRDVDDASVAVVIRNLKIVQDRSKVIVMDSNGARSKVIARFLRKLGVKKSYLVQGGFESWMKSGLRIKENKPETAVTILSQEAEAILEGIRPTPVKLIGYGVVLSGGIYALLEWEKTLQFIGIVGIGQTVYQRVASYKSAEDLKQDVRLGAQAFSWAAGRVEPNKIGLPTSPSSTAVQSRVLQAAAKHESQPPDAEETQDSSLESPPASENVDLSEA